MILVLSFILVVLTAVGQLLLKRGATKQDGSILINRYVIVGYLIFFLIVIVSYFLMHIMAMKNFTVVMSISYIAVALAARLVLKEKVGTNRAIGTFLICIGVFVFLMN